jgi:hypothetical protein
MFSVPWWLSNSVPDIFFATKTPGHGVLKDLVFTQMTRMTPIKNRKSAFIREICG